MPGATQDHPEDRFQKLVASLSEKLGPSSGINSEDVNERELQKLMEEYQSDESEWEKYFFPAECPTVPYTRNLVDKGNGKSNLVSLKWLSTECEQCSHGKLILVWSPGKGSPVHE